jgi:hypothetical protein
MRQGGAGQSSLELLITASAIVVVMVALSLYVRHASAGRQRSVGANMSDILFDSNTSTTRWTVPGSTTIEATAIVGGRPASAGDPGLAGVGVRTSRTPTGGLSRRTDQL